MINGKIIKVCGMRAAENIRAVEAIAGVDLFGFIFYPKSPRFVDTPPAYLPENALRVGVFVNEAQQVVVEKIDRFALYAVQLHGDESPEYCRTLQQTGVKVIKAFSIAGQNDLKQTADYATVCDYFLFDTRCEGYGGSGKSFDWTLLSEYDGNTPFLLSGGIALENIEAIKTFEHPRLIGYDLNSRFETAPAQKNPKQIEHFLTALKPNTKAMNHISKRFNSKSKNLLSIYFCAGTPTLEGTADTIRALEKHGVDMIEIGIPFSDPMADGAVIQNAATEALRNGMSLKLLFEQLQDIRSTVTIPLVLMGYLNPIMQFGFENFCRKCAECGIDGVIIPDLPFRDYLADYRAVAKQYDVKVIVLITPETSEERVREIDAHTDGFIYMVSSAATTGAQHDFDSAKRAYFKRIDAMKLNNPLMVGFGISNRETFNAACEYASGAIIGSKFVSLLNEERDAERAIVRLKEALQ